MSNNCLYKKLKGTVSSNEFPLLNALEFSFHAGDFTAANSTLVVNVNSGSDVDYKSTAAVQVYNNSSLISENTEGTLTAGGKYYIKFPNTEGKFWFLKKYGTIDNLSRSMSDTPIGKANDTLPFSFDFDISQLDYVTDIALDLLASLIVGKFNPTQPIQTLWTVYAVSANPVKSLKIDISCFSAATTGIYARILNLHHTGACGNIESLAACAAMIALTIQNTDCRGELTTLLNSLKSIGATRNIFISAADSLVTYNGELLTKAKIKELNEGGNDELLKIHIENGSWSITPTA